jgi:hypothetical protein
MLSLDRYRWPLVTVLFGHMLITIGAALVLPAIRITRYIRMARA